MVGQNLPVRAQYLSSPFRGGVKIDEADWLDLLRTGFRLRFEEDRDTQDADDVLCALDLTIRQEVGVLPSTPTESSLPSGPPEPPRQPSAGRLLYVRNMDQRGLETLRVGAH